MQLIEAQRAFPDFTSKHIPGIRLPGLRLWRMESFGSTSR